MWNIFKSNKKLTIFVVDDEEDVLEIYSEMVESIIEDCKVHSFVSAEKADNAISKGTIPDVILCDIAMPDLSGMKWKNNLLERDIQIPFIFISGLGSDTFTNREDETILEKPVDKSTLKQELFRKLKQIDLTSD